MPENLILETRRASFAPSTFNRAAGTVDAILSAGADVPRRDARGPFTERLDPAAMTIRNGADRVPLLDSHNRGSVAAVLGYADNIRNASGEIRATLHIADERTLNLIEASALSGTSIGFLPTADKWSTDADGRRIRQITAAALVEASLTAFPADPNASILRSEIHMPDEIIETTDRAQINGQIRNVVRTAGLPAEFADGLIDRSSSLAETRAAAFDEIIRRGVRIPAVQIGTSGDDPATILTRMSSALAHRIGVPGDLPDDARQYRSMSLHDMCRNLLAARGEAGVLGLGVEALITRAIAISDLPALLESTGQRALLAQYELALSPVFKLARETTNNDFRKKTTIRLGELELLEVVNEGGEVSHGGVGDSAEAYSLATYGKIFSITRQALINDDLGAFSSMSAAQGRAAAETQNNLIVSLLTQGSGLGPTLQTDSVRLFNSAHGNVSGSAAAITLATLAAGVLAMRSQKGIDGVTPINVVPKTLLVPAGLETAARQGVASYYPPSAAAVNTLAGAFEVAVEPRLSGTRWYLFADPAIMPVLEFAFLAGAPGPQMLARAGFEHLGLEFRVILDFGSGVIDFRGCYTNAGA